MQRLAIALALLCCGASAAQADWEYTRWGMTPAEVSAAAKNRAKPGTDLHPDSDGNVTKLVAPYQSGKFSFEAQFGFNKSDQLSSVTLVLTDKSAGMMDMGGDMNMGGMKMDAGDCRTLRQTVKARYGVPKMSDGAHMQYGIETWADRKAGNNVKYTVLDRVGCYVQYSVMGPAGAH